MRRLARSISVPGGIVLVTVLTVALELALIGATGVDVNPLHVASAHAQSAAESPPDPSIDCDNDDDGGTDDGEGIECLTNSVRQFVLDNSDLILDGALGLAIGVGLIVVVPYAFPLLFAGPEFVAAFGTIYSTGVAGTGLTVPFLEVLALDGLTIRALTILIHNSSARAAAQASDIALPAPLPVGVPGKASILATCRPAKRRAECRRIAPAARTYALSLARTTSVMSALALTVTRLHGAGTDPGRQTGTAKVLALRLLEALNAQHAAGLAYARVLRHEHANLRLSAAQVRRALTALGNLKGVPKAVVRRLERELQLSELQLKQALRRSLARTIARGSGFDFVKELERPLTTTGLREAYDSLTIVEVSRLVAQLGYEKRISRPNMVTLINDVLIAQRACSPLQRRGPMNKFVADVRAGVSGPYAQFLQDAAVPLFGNHAYPKNKPPTADFTPLNRTSGVSPGHPLHAIFRETSDDKSDGGDVGCWEWNFGDPASGASNVSFLRNPTHDYAAPGNYTVTLTAVDDDGFGRNSKTGLVTATP